MRSGRCQPIVQQWRGSTRVLIAFPLQRYLKSRKASSKRFGTPIDGCRPGGLAKLDSLLRNKTAIIS
jgi:hypothetical protein